MINTVQSHVCLLACFLIIVFSHSTLIYTSELILCSHICVYSATRHNIHMFFNKFDWQGDRLAE